MILRGPPHALVDVHWKKDTGQGPQGERGSGFMIHDTDYNG